MHYVSTVGQAASLHIFWFAFVYLILRQPVQRIQMEITLKRETIMAWDALPVRMKLHTPAQQDLVSKNRSTGHCFVLWTLLLSCDKAWVIVVS